MAGRFRGRLPQEPGRPFQGVQAVLYDTSNQKVDVSVSNESGIYEFLNVPEGNYEVRFFGRNYGPEDYVSIVIVTNFGYIDGQAISIRTVQDPNEAEWFNEEVEWYLEFEEFEESQIIAQYKI
jgi:hypothetical protein